MSARRAFRVFRGYESPSFDLVPKRNRWFVLSGVVLALSLVGLIWQGLNFSIDFTGGSLISYENRTDVSVEDVRTLLGEAPYDRADAEIQLVGGNRLSIRTTSLTDLSSEERAQLVDDLARQAGVTPNDISTQVVGPTWGNQISRQAVIGLIVVLIAISLYITLRFEWKMAIGAMVAMVHDVVITAGVYALTGREVSPATVIAILTILGFSLYDTVVIYDKITENTESPTMMAKQTYEQVANFSLNHVLMRSVNTSLVVVLPILSLLLFGGDTLKDFAFAMLIGVITGAYSSIFVAAPILVVLKERESRYQTHRARLEGRGAERTLRAVRTASPEAEVVPEAEPAAVGAAAAARATARTGTSARPRPKSRRKPPAKRKRRLAAMDLEQVKALVRDVPDFPQEGIVFKDITPLLADELAFSTVIDLIVVHFGRGNVDKVVGIEARGFILASPVAYHFGAGFVPVRKKDKLPWATESAEYSLEYGSATLEIHQDAVAPGERVLIVDDVLATGGTARATAELVERIGGQVIGLAFLIELGFLKGRDRLEGYDLLTLLEY